MRKVFTFLVLLLTALGMQAESKFYIAEQKIQPGETQKIEVNLLNEAICEGFQMKITLPEGVTFLEDEEEEDYVVKTSRVPKKFIISADTVSPNVLNIVGYLDAGKIIEAGDGAIFTILVKAADDAPMALGKITISGAEINLENKVDINPDDISFGFNVYGQCTVKVVSADEAQGTVTGGGEGLDSGTKTTIEATPKTGYNFVGWYDGTTLVSSNAKYDYEITKNVTFTAKFEIQKFTVIFNDKNGDPIVTKTDVEYGSQTLAIVPSIPDVTGHHFTGWKPGLDETVTADVTYTAQYEPNVYTITFQGKEGEDISKQDLAYGASITVPTPPTYEGYTFKEWSPAVPATVPENGDETYKAIYTVNEYTVTFTDHAGSTATKMSYGATLTAPTPATWAGHDFIGWTPEVPATVPAKDIEFTADYETQHFDITYKVDGEVYETLSGGYELALPADPDDPEKEGYTFKGWKWDTTDEKKPATMPANALTATALFEINQYTVTFKVDGAVVGTPATADYGTDITAPADPEKVGYTFIGWGENYTGKVPGADTTYEAQWKVNLHKITYDLPDGVYAEFDEIEYGAEIPVVEDPEKEGHTFAEWVYYNETDGTGIAALPATMPDYDIYAQGDFTVNKYTVKFVNEADEVISEETDAVYGTSVRIPAYEDNEEKLEKEGYIFTGWQAVQNSDLVYEAEDIEITVPAYDVVFKAQYIPNISIYAYVLDGDIILVDSLRAGESFEPLADPVKEGYTFSGWQNVPEDGLMPVVTPGDTLFISGSYTVNQYTITYIAYGETINTTTLDYGTKVPAFQPEESRYYTFLAWDNEVPATMPAEDLTFTAIFTVASYDLTYKVDGEVYKVVSTKYDSSVTPLADPEKEGYTFNGWTGVPETMPARNVTVNGSFTVNQYTVTFVVGDETLQSETLDYGTAITVPAAPEKEGYEFAGWGDVAETVPAADVTYVAQYRAVEQEIEAVEEEKTFTFSEELANGDGGTVLENIVVNNTYYNLDAADGSGYDAEEECLVLNTAVSAETMEEVVDAELGSEAMAEKYTGIIIAVNGKGTIKIDYQTLGATALDVQVGNAEAASVQSDERGISEIEYDVNEETYVYIYAASTASAEAKKRAAAAANSVKIWAITIVPEGIEVAIDGIGGLTEGAEGFYTLDGRKLNVKPVQKGVYILNGKKVYVK